MVHQTHILLLLVLISFSKICHSWDWLSRSSTKAISHGIPSKAEAISDGSFAQFSLEAHDNQKRIERVNKAEKRIELVGSKSCQQNAYQRLLSGCSVIIADEDKKRRLAWDLSDCFQKDSGVSPFPSRGAHSNMKDCLRKMIMRHIASFFFYTDGMCHQLQLSMIAST
ncbi:hypothetical protein L1049_023372 [Liquidambar formosana]|uniref:Uncharacterized protein n=1 Tax=Liquidambar formosana TaxID=63359 RepID=A0AAP0RTS8_LIQFO